MKSSLAVLMALHDDLEALFLEKLLYFLERPP